jgi:hypothetical protein
MNKLFLALGGLGLPAAAFAVHVSSCCGNVWCCLRHLGCC